MSRHRCPRCKSNAPAKVLPSELLLECTCCGTVTIYPRDKNAKAPAPEPIQKVRTLADLQAAQPKWLRGPEPREENELGPPNENEP